ncbi:hypothetical protein B0J13DRAFT_599485 [Dactylonectria estremocensis]|uniref:Rhodopsin domain-containing protein n=1 Tax=Dactylonectria estremocensis TaxID=1079267 RepID=A0A9P9DJ94_9HYPO|nr:hypothetical protein B0J13DRAFT_599485 [Dactylonectria estremocensis]
MAVTVDPIIVAAFGEPPDGVDLEEKLVENQNVAVSVVFGLAVAAVALRLYVRRFKGGARLWLDDYAIVLSTFCCGATVAVTVLAGEHGAGEHIWVSKLPRVAKLLKVIYAQGFVYGLAVTTTKISVLLLYRRLLYSNASPTSMFSILFWVALFLAITYPIILWVTLITACRPISYFWTQYSGAEGTCINIKLFFLTLGIINMLNDVVILLVPIPRILELQLSRRVKASTIGIMMLGGFVCIASIVRIYYLHQFFEQLDSTWWIGPTLAWSSIEPSVGIISACLPTFAPLFRFNHSSRSNSNPYYTKDKTEASRRGTMIASNMRSPRFGISSPSRNNTSHVMEEDEVELTCKVGCGDTVSSLGQESKRNSADERERGIVVYTHVSVVSSERKETPIVEK